MAEHIITDETTRVTIGYQAENDVETFVFPAYEDYGAALNVRRPGEDTVYPATLTRVDDGWAWTVANTWLVNKGFGEAQVTYADGNGKVKKKRIYDIYVNRSLVADGEIPDPWESTYVELMERIAEVTADVGRAETAAANAEQSAESANASATIAQQAASEAGLSAEAASLSSRSASNSATNAADSAELAEGFKTVAQTAATEALTSATNAGASASQAAASAQSAADKADAVLDLTVTAKGLPEGSTPTAERSIVGEHYNIDFGIPAGATGAKGDKGDAGFSPSAKVTQDGDITTIEVTDEQGTTSAEIDLGDYMKKTDAWALLPTDTASGAVASFSDGADDVPMISLVANVEPVQDLHGYENPWPAGGGVNKLDASADNLIDYTASYRNYTYADGVVVTTGNTLMGFIAKVSPSTEYTVSFVKTTTGSCNMRIREFRAKPTAWEDDNFIAQTVNGSIASTTVNAVRSFTTTAETEYIIFALYTTQSIEVSKWQLELGSDATAWQPYDNVCPISGWTAAEVTKAGKNLFDFNRVQGTPTPSTLFESPRVMETDKWYKGLRPDNYYYPNYVICTIENNVLTVTTLTNNTYGVGFPMPCKPNTTYIVSAETTEGSTFSVGCYDKDWNFLSRLKNTTIYSGSFAITTPDDAAYITIIIGSTINGTATVTNIQVELGSATAYEPYNGTTITHEFKDAQGNTLTVYGGEDELIGGKLRVTMAEIDLGTLTWDHLSWGYRSASLRGTIKTPSSNASAANIRSDRYTTQVYESSDSNGISVSSDGYLAVIASDSPTGQLVYELAKPIEYDLTREDIRTLYGDNTIFADCGDVSVTYKADIAKWVEKKLGS